MILTFGKYNGEDIRNVPQDYIEWLIGTREADLRDYKAELERRKAIEEASMSIVEKIAHSGYKALARTLHPDAGGDTEQFKQLGMAYEQLKAILAEVKQILAGS